ncbi:hypothetical protein OK016_26645 [Vibrio chagasii]|nr:hypothetical protein [Vibrio chagasii]
MRKFTRDSQLGVLSAKSSDGQVANYQVMTQYPACKPGVKIMKAIKVPYLLFVRGLPEVEVNETDSLLQLFGWWGYRFAIDGDTDTRQYGYDELGRLVKLSSNSTTVYYEYDELIV